MLARMWFLLRPRGGWFTLFLLLFTVGCLPFAIADARWLIGALALVGLTLLAAWAGYAMGHTRLPGWLVAAVGGLSGIEWNAVVIGRLLPSAGAILRELARSSRWLMAGLQGEWTSAVPLVPLAPDIWTRAQALGERLAAWSQAGLTGTVNRDSLVLLLFAAIGVWWVSYFAGWQLARGRSALWALLPAGIAILSNVSLTYGRGVNYLRAYLGGALLLMATGHIDRLQRRWEREHIDYSLEVRRSVQLVGAALATGLVLMSLLVPFFTVRQAIDFFWRRAYEPWTRITQRLDRMFAGRNPVPTPRGTGGRPSGEPHELTGEVNPGTDLVLYVSTSDPAPMPIEERMGRGGMPYGQFPEEPKHYWRELTYDTYTGRGWENSQTRRVERPASVPLTSADFPHTVLTQTYEVVVPGKGVVPAVNEPVQVLTTATTLILRGPADVAGIVLGDRQYTVISAVPSPTVNDLRAAGTGYPPDIADRYLALPPIPERVQSLAEELTAQTQTPYDKAVAIETHLRSYDYDLKIQAPPPGYDVADYLLFQTRRGYCDYYATAMVVMLRAVGVPARYASGYAMGTYDHQRHVYVVTERDAHAWVEVYFPGYGWVEFEPTPYRTSFSRPVGASSASLPDEGLVRPQKPWWEDRSRWAAPLVLLVAALALGGVFWWVLATVRGWQRVETRQLVRKLYAQMLRWAVRVHLGPAPGDTPLEFGTRLGKAVEGRGPWAEGALEEARTITTAYVYARYAPTPLSARDAGRALTAWGQLQSKLRWLYFWRR